LKLPLRQRTRQASVEAPRGSQAAERRSPPSVVTSWLRQGLRTGMCPLCRVAHKADREYIWHFFDVGADQGESIDAVRRAYGFCAEHIEMLRRIDMDAMKSTLAITLMLADTLAGIVEDLDTITPDRPFRRDPCPACANRDQHLRANARYLVDELATAPRHRLTFEASPGLCFVHFELVWELAPAREDRQLLLNVQRNAARSLLRDLQEHARKHDHKFRHEPKGPEQDSWQRAILVTAGWPPPAESAGEPERRR
jgi:uncharacterized protein DUF6062